MSDETIVDRELQTHMILTSASNRAVYAAPLYRVTVLRDIVQRGKKVKEYSSRIEQGRGVHPYQVKNPERARVLQFMIIAAAELNRGILELLHLEEEEAKNKKKATKRRK